MSTIDIVARLQMKADQFSSENGRAFAEMRSRAQSTAQEVRGTFNSTFADVQKIAAQAFTLPRNAGGGLDLSKEIEQLTTSAASAERKSEILRQLSVATLSAANAAGVDAEAMKRESDAAAVGARMAEQEAAAHRDRATALRATQVELNKLGGAIDIAVTAGEKHKVTTGAQRAAMQQLSFQAQDAFTQIGMGANVMQVVAVQGAQVAGAFANVGGKAGAVASFFMGPWGLAINAGLMFLGPLVTKLFQTGDAADHAKKGTDQLASVVGNLGGYFDNATGRIKETNKALIEYAILSRQKQVDEARTAMRENATKGAAARSASLRDLKPVFVERGLGTQLPRTINPDLVNALSTSDPDAALRQIARGRSTNAAQAAALLKERADFAQSLRQVNKLNEEIRSLQSGTLASSLRTRDGGGGSSRTTILDQEAKLAAATTARERAQAQLALTQSRGRAAVDAGTMSEAQYRTEVTAGERAVNAAEAAERSATQGRRDANKERREAAAAARKAEQAERELVSTLDQVAAKYDPARAAARAYRGELDEIAKLVTAGKLTQGEGIDYMMRARQNATAARGREFNDAFRTVMGEDSVGRAVTELNDGIMSATELWNNRLELGAMRAGEALGGAISNISDMFGLRVTGPVNALIGGGLGVKSNETAKLIAEGLKGTGINLSTQSIDKLSGALAGAAVGQIGGSVFSSITGAKQNKAGSAIGGVAGDILGKELGGTITKAIGGKVGSMFGSAAGPIGAALGGALGSVVGNLFGGRKADYGSAVLTAGSQVATGTNRAATNSAGSLGTSVQQGLDRIADQLGGTIGNYLVSIGTYDGKFRVSTSGQSGELSFGKSNKNKATLVDFGEDQEGAIRYAILDALNDGAVKGISDAAARVLRAGKDLDAAISKAVLIESVPRDLKAMLDPVGAAIDDLNRKFQKTVDALKEGGASADQMAQAQRLYELQLQQVKASTAAASATLKDFLTDLKLGGNSAYSLRDQEAAALAQLKPFLDQIGSGANVDQGKYQTAARAYLDVERQLYGSTSKFFDAQSLIQAATAKAIETIDKAVPIATGTDSPFSKATADSAAATAAAVKVGNEMTEDTNKLLVKIAELMKQVAANTGGDTGSGFIGEARGFV